MIDPHEPAFYEKLLWHVRQGLSKTGWKASAVSDLELRRGVAHWTGIHEEWGDREIYELNVAYLVGRFAQSLRKANLTPPSAKLPPVEADLDPIHAVAYVTAEDDVLQEKVHSLRVVMNASPEPQFPWLEHGYRQARWLAWEWFDQQGLLPETYECELVIRLKTSERGALSLHLNEVANMYAKDQAWAQRGQLLTPELAAALASFPEGMCPKVIVETFPASEEDIRSLGVSLRTVGDVLSLPGNSYNIVVPASGHLRDVVQALKGIALLTPWWDTSHALEYVLTGHPPLPNKLANRPEKGPGQGRRHKVLTRQHVALLEVKHRMPSASWTQRRDVFNGWCDRVENLRPFTGGTSPQAIREEHKRACARARRFCPLVEQSEARIKLERPDPKLW